LSETVVDSDRKREKAPEVVRNRSGFGQKKRKSAWRCPKPEWIRTGKEKRRLKLSETGVDSDRKKEKAPGDVRNRVKKGIYL
jgi:hypothetical protein